MLFLYLFSLQIVLSKSPLVSGCCFVNFFTGNHLAIVFMYCIIILIAGYLQLHFQVYLLRTSMVVLLLFSSIFYFSINRPYVVSIFRYFAGRTKCIFFNFYFLFLLPALLALSFKLHVLRWPTVIMDIDHV